MAIIWDNLDLLKGKICHMNLILKFLFLFGDLEFLEEKCLIYKLIYTNLIKFRSRQIVSNIDIAPTILEMAGLNLNTSMDGRSILKLIEIEKNSSFYLLFFSIKILGGKFEQQNSYPWRQTLLIERGKMPKLRKIKDRFLKQKNFYSKEIRINNECKKSKLQTPCLPKQVIFKSIFFLVLYF